MSECVVSGVVADWSIPDKPTYTFTVTRQETVTVGARNAWGGAKYPGWEVNLVDETSFAPSDVPVEFRNAILEWVNRG